MVYFRVEPVTLKCLSRNDEGERALFLLLIDISDVIVTFHLLYFVQFRDWAFRVTGVFFATRVRAHTYVYRISDRGSMRSVASLSPLVVILQCFFSTH